MQRRDSRAESAEEAALRLVQEQAAELLRFARRFSHCADDAHDAYQRTLEILVGRLRTDPPLHLLPWLRTVLRHEALALRREREQLLGRDAVDLDCHQGGQLDDPAERVVSFERLRHTAEALQRLKPQEVTALVLRAEGLTYKEICARTGWTYTRTNRAVTEGRQALRARLGAIESGAECARWLPLLSALADGEATARQLAGLRPHLRSCSACRSTLRDFHAAPSRVAALVPAALVPVALAPLAAAPGGPLPDHVGLGLHGLAERLTLLAARVQGAFEALPGAKVAAVAASTAALAGGGAALQQAVHERPAAHVASAAVAPSASAQLLTIAAPLRPASIASPAMKLRRTERRGEFAPPPVAEPEFVAHAAAATEFASSSASPPALRVAAATTTSPPRPAAEFAGP